MDREAIIKEARSQMAREAVEARWGRLDEEGRRVAVRPANEARKRNAAKRRQQQKERQAGVEGAAVLRRVMLEELGRLLGQ